MIARIRALWAELRAIGDPVDLDQPDHVTGYYDFWQGIVEHPDGTLNMDQLQRELADYRMVIGEVSQVYDHITNGRISKPNTSASAVISVADDIVNDLVAEALRDTTTPAQWLEQQAAEYAAACNNPALRARMPAIPDYLANPHQPLPAVDDTPTLRALLLAALDEHTLDGIACRDHYDEAGEPIPHPCHIVVETRAALGMPALNLEGAEHRG